MGHGAGLGGFSPPPISRVMVYILEVQQSTIHDISENDFEETFCVLSIICRGYYGYRI